MIRLPLKNTNIIRDKNLSVLPRRPRGIVNQIIIFHLNTPRFMKTSTTPLLLTREKSMHACHGKKYNNIGCDKYDKT